MSGAWRRRASSDISGSALRAASICSANGTLASFTTTPIVVSAIHR